MARRILIVDDEAPILDLLREGLEGGGYAVDAVASASQALALIKDNLYDAAILDFALPDMNGVMLHHEIRRMDAELADRTLFISGRAQSEADLSYYTAAAAGFLAKPFEIDHLLAALHELVGQDGDPES
jgi:two-component system phosphate regulon response regulator PhoB